MWNMQNKGVSRFLIPMFLIGTITLSGCSPFSFKTVQSTQVAQAKGRTINENDVISDSPKQETGNQSESESGDKNSAGGSDSQGKVSDVNNEGQSQNSSLPPVPEVNPPTNPIPEPDPPNTPIRPFYELTGTPPTAPGLAMKHRNFKKEPKKIAYLTIDDGPSNNTVRILKTLQDEDVRATFFVIGLQVERYPQLLKQVYEQGNAIGNHTYSHNYAEIYKSPEDYLANIKKNEDLIYKLIGIRPKIIRTPGGTQGHYHISYYNMVDAQDYLVYDWNVSTGDASAPLVPAEQIVKNVMTQVPGKDRVIILMHDAPGKTTTPDALPQIIRFLRNQGYEFGVLTPEVAPILFPGGFRS